MIKGLRLRISSLELQEGMRERAKYHDQRAQTKSGDLPELRKIMESMKHSPATAVSNMSKGNYQMDNSNPVEALEADIRGHHQKAIAFRYMADHLFDEDYDLDENDLIRLEILRR